MCIRDSVHTLTDKQVNDLYSDLVTGCEEAYEDASEKAEDAIARVYMQGEGEYRGIDPYGLPESDEEPVSEKGFCATKVLRGAMSDMKNADVDADDNEGSIRYIYR